MDTGASSHICVNPNSFFELTILISPIFVNLSNGSMIKVTKLGTIILNGLKLTETLFLPSFSHNLLSVYKLTLSNPISCLFFPNFCMSQDQKSEKLLAVGKVVDHLYFLDQSSFTPVILDKFSDKSFFLQCIADSYLHNSISFPEICTVTSDDNAHLWHTRMGHPSDQALHHLPFSFDVKSGDTICDVCHLAKQNRRSFPHSFIQTTSSFELIHVDIWGPYNTTTLTRASYFLTTVDVFTRATWTFLMAYKNQATSMLEKFFYLIQNC